MDQESLENWKDADRPNYETNVDLRYPYSELPFLGEFRLKKLPFHDKVLEHVDYWGQGRIVTTESISGFPKVYNINNQYQVVTDGPDLNTKIPNRIPVVDDNVCDTSAYIKDNSVRTVTLKASEINKHCAIDIARMIHNEIGRIILYDFPSNSESFKNVNVVVNQKNLFFCPHYELPSEFKIITSNTFAVFLNYSDLKKIIYHNIASGKYDEAVEQTRWMNSNVMEDFVRGLFNTKSSNIISFAYQLWESNEKDIVRKHFPPSFNMILDSSSVVIGNQQYPQYLTIQAPSRGNKVVAWGANHIDRGSVWYLKSFWGNNAVSFKIINPYYDYYLELDKNVDRYGDRLAWGTAIHNEYKETFELEAFLKNDGEAEYFIINCKYGQGLKLDVNTNSQGNRYVWGNKDDVHGMEILEKSKRFRWIVKNPT